MAFILTQTHERLSQHHLMSNGIVYIFLTLIERVIITYFNSNFYKRKITLY